VEFQYVNYNIYI